MKDYLLSDKGQWAAELIIANKELAFQNEEKEKRAAELFIANKELAFQNEEKENRAAELVIANKELVYQNKEKGKRAAELIIANEELAFQNEEKENRAAELIIANKELVFQNDEKENRAAELVIANKELAFQNQEKESRAAELIIANKELAFQNEEKENRAAELIIANKELVFQNEEKENRAAELAVANKELAFQNQEKESRAAELIIANIELAFQNREKGKRAAELIIANKELAFQNEEKENRAAELVIANKELVFQNNEKEKRATELVIANRLYAFNSAINQTLVHSKDEQTVFNEACRIAIEVGKFELAAISIPDETKKNLNIAAHANALSGDIEFLNNIIYDDEGPTGKVLRSGKIYAINDYKDEPTIGVAKTFASERGFKSCILLPIKKSGKTIGVCNLFSTGINLFDEEEITLLEEAAGDISFALDIFEKEKHRKQMEDKVIHNALRLNQAQAIAHFGSWEHTFSTGISEWSDEFCRIYGFDNCDNVHSSETWESFIHPEDMNHVMMVNKRGKDSLGNFACHHRILRKDGTIRYVYSQTQYEFDIEGIPIGMHGVIHDITDMKEAEAERSTMVADIVQRNKDLEQFSYIISHNLRAPVANILGLVDVIQTDGLDSKEKVMATSYLSVATRNLDMVIRDINYILDLKHNVNEKREIVKFAELLSEVKMSLSSAINGERASITGDFSAMNGLVTFRSYLYSIFLNLISNSIKYRRQGIYPAIEITSSVLDDKILIIFKDNGLGIDLEQNGKYLFGLYKRFHNHVDGKGMGLYMVKAQVESLGGKITATSEVNVGTEFRLEFDFS